jgi:hypothetical protein
MSRKTAQRLLIGGSLLLVIALTATSAFPQQIEINPYAGGFFGGEWSETDLRKEAVFGVRGGVYLMDFVELDLNYGYINHFALKDTTPDLGTRAYIWDVNASYSLTGYTTSIGAPLKKLEPFLTIGLGGLTIGVHNASGQAFSRSPSTPLKDNDSFLQFSYGGGVKAIRLWGPIGLRADFRGRTLPNFYGSSLTFFEATGGFNIMWGER